MGSDRRRDGRGFGWVTLAGGSLVALFWVFYFTGSAPFGQEDRVQAAFESAFVFADALLAAMLFAASWELLRGGRAGPFLLVLAAGMCLYLGVLDMTFYARHGLYWPLAGPGLFQLVVNALCLGGGALGLSFGWSLWRAR